MVTIGPRLIRLYASQENWVECMKSRLTGKLPPENNVKRQISSF